LDCVLGGIFGDKTPIFALVDFPTISLFLSFFNFKNPLKTIFIDDIFYESLQHCNDGVDETPIYFIPSIDPRMPSSHTVTSFATDVCAAMAIPNINDNEIVFRFILQPQLYYCAPQVFIIFYMGETRLKLSHFTVTKRLLLESPNTCCRNRRLEKPVFGDREKERFEKCFIEKLYRDSRFYIFSSFSSMLSDFCCSIFSIWNPRGFEPKSSNSKKHFFQIGLRGWT
jgi:hypothetical protein